MRINLDSQWFGDPRWRLAGSLANENPLLTRGRIENIWHYCYIQRSATLSVEDIDVQAEWIGEVRFADILVKARLAESLGDGHYRLKGVTERIQFLLSQSERGKAGAEARKRTLSERLADAKQVPSERQASAKQPLNLSPALSPAPAQALSPDINTKAQKTPRAQTPDGAGASVSKFLASYSEEYKGRYGVNPPIGGKSAGIGKRIIQEAGLEKAQAAVIAYLDCKDDWFKTKAHDLATFEQNLTRFVGLASVRKTSGPLDWSNL